ncbi:O-antigen ligase [Muricauda sp. MAR_2010_75]|uniref:O-antigen ligase family protein n=1 Tax=Allomuricauda sp. MAR_2010_75 TaxID=1250232 RepID=UPI00056042F2|nr:O-antigen ligase family protein [Muricauda sp. MAR_2010_75]
MNLKVPYIIIAFLLAFDNVFIKFRLGGLISIDRGLEFLFFFILFKPYLTALKTNSFFRGWNIFLVAFTLLLFLVNLRILALNEIETKYVLIDLFKGFSFIVFSYLFFLIAQKNLKYVNVVLIGHFFICLFALLQHPISPIASEMFEFKRFLFSNVTEGSRVSGTLENEDMYISGGYADRFRLAGPFASTISFSYFAISSFCMAFFMYIKTKKRIYMGLLGVLFVCSILTQTRSLLLGELVIIGGYFFFVPHKKRPMYQSAMFVAGLLLSLFVVVGQDYFLPKNSRLTKLSSEGESDSRPLLWLTGVTAAVTYPFGVSQKEYKAVKQDMYHKFGHTAILHLTSHNGIINVGIYYSLLGYGLLFMLVKFLLEHNRNSNSIMRVFFILCLLGYATHISFHNNIFLSADYPFFMVLMLLGLESQGLLSKPEEESQHLSPIPD